MSTLKVNAIEPYSGGTVTITGGTIDSASYAENANALTSGNKLINGVLGISGSISPSQGSGIHLKENSFAGGTTPSYLRFYSGSTEGVNYINMQNEPNGNGRVTISAFPANDHFFFLDPNTHVTEFDGEISGYAGKPLRIKGNGAVTGSINQTIAAPGTFQEINNITLTGASVNGKNYSLARFGIADYSPFGTNFEDYFAIEYYDSFGYNFGSEFNVNGQQTRLSTAASGSGAISEIKTTDNYNGTSQLSLNSNNILVTTLGNYADDVAAAAGGVQVNGLYRSGSHVMIRVS